jgi:hypothetical protein
MLARWVGHGWLTGVRGAQVPAGIYGTVLCASILASAGDEPTVRVAIVVLVTLFVYWLAERYAEVLGLVATASGEEQGGPRLSEGTPSIDRAHLREVLGRGWTMIQASVTPLVVLLGSRLLGASRESAVDIALAYTVVLLVGLGSLGAQRAGLTGWPRTLATAFSAFLGLLVVALKASLH